MGLSETYRLKKSMHAVSFCAFSGNMYYQRAIVSRSVLCRRQKVISASYFVWPRILKQKPNKVTIFDTQVTFSLWQLSLLPFIASAFKLHPVFNWDAAKLPTHHDHGLLVFHCYLITSVVSVPCTKQEVYCRYTCAVFVVLIDGHALLVDCWFSFPSRLLSTS